MKKLTLLFLCVLMLAAVCGWAESAVSAPEPIPLSKMVYPEYILLSENHWEAVKLYSPIDRAYNKSRLETDFIDSYANEFISIWRLELDYQYAKCSNNMPEKHKKEFAAQQSAWETYYDNDVFPEIAFFEGTGYGYTREAFLIRLDRVRRRTIEIMRIQTHIEGISVAFSDKVSRPIIALLEEENPKYTGEGVWIETIEAAARGEAAIEQDAQALTAGPGAAAGEADYVRLAIKGTNVNLRPGPRTSGVVVAQVNTGDVFIAERNPVLNDGDRSLWYKIVLAAVAGSNKISALSERDSRFNNDPVFVREDFATISPLEEGDAERILAARGAMTMGDNSFVELCVKGTPQEVEAAIKNGANPNAEDEYGRLALMTAAYRQNNIAVMSVLLKNGADVNGTSFEKKTPLMYAAGSVGSENSWEANPEAISFLLENGANVNARDRYEKTALIYAADTSEGNVKGGNPEAVSLLLKNGADVNARDEDGWTALSYAALHANPEVISILLKNGADVSGNDLELAQSSERLKNTAVIEEMRKNIKR